MRSSLSCLVAPLAVWLSGCAATEPALGPPPAASAAGTNAAAVFAVGPPAPGRPVTVRVPPPGPVQDNDAALAAACRTEAERVILLRDRGQIFREDERDARLGIEGTIYELRTPLDRLGRAYAADQLATDCVRQNSHTGPAR